MISPVDIGMPSKFTTWRPGQEKIITAMLYPAHRFTVQAVPTGGGKTACYMATALTQKKRTVILTSTKGLQDQLEKDFSGLVCVVKGQSAYKCRLSGDLYTCNTGSCHWGFQCPHKSEDCRYQVAVRKAKQATIVVTNYSFWMSNPPDVLGDFYLMVMDEAHDAAEHLLNALSTDIRRDEVSHLIDWIGPNAGTRNYYEWAKILKGRVDDAVKRDGGKRGTRGKYSLLALQQKLLLFNKIWADNWVVEHKGKSISWDVIWPAKLAPSYLFKGIKHIIMTSATITKADVVMLGLTPAEYTFDEYPSSFPVGNRRVYFIPTVRLDRFITTAGMNAWSNRIDNIVGARLGYKGLIHTVSYDRATRVCNISKYKDFMMSHTGKTTAETMVRFKEADPPCILVSPSMVTGYDFPDDDARYQIIGKVPFPDSRPLVIKARQLVNPDYGCYLAIKQLIQASGRTTRSPEDWSETFIIDNHLQWVLGKYKSIIPKWWMDSVVTTNLIPQARG
jgi:Rad3-related DNA helicase